MSALPEFIGKVAMDVVDLQEILDQSFEEQIDLYLPYLKAFSQEQVGNLINEALLPRRRFVSKQSFNCQLSLEVNRSRGFELSCNTIPLHYKSLMEETAKEENLLDINIEQVTLAKNPFTDSSKT